ncbi:hypothetical protein CAPTEDRAFT_217143 [Capitella teleta]|uniref:Uncharacterized protein n=1 Tax=Capitella teleta TaxID=283909 RepID=R7VKW5_CAPTE|nr:hypothetical protein CAPTEDRAFT_217143 [Capitella teleta]|eukprot:ELU17120.1 hypothetical protein CAPTEDRAFT_217143 [Capitella teleta]
MNVYGSQSSASKAPEAPSQPEANSLLTERSQQQTLMSPSAHAATQQRMPPKTESTLLVGLLKEPLIGNIHQPTLTTSQVIMSGGHTHAVPTCTTSVASMALSNFQAVPSLLPINASMMLPTMPSSQPSRSLPMSPAVVPSHPRPTTTIHHQPASQLGMRLPIVIQPIGCEDPPTVQRIVEEPAIRLLEQFVVKPSPTVSTKREILRPDRPINITDPITISDSDEELPPFPIEPQGAQDCVNALVNVDVMRLPDQPLDLSNPLSRNSTPPIPLFIEDERMSPAPACSTAQHSSARAVQPIADIPPQFAYSRTILIAPDEPPTIVKAFPVSSVTDDDMNVSPTSSSTVQQSLPIQTDISQSYSVVNVQSSPPVPITHSVSRTLVSWSETENLQQPTTLRSTILSHSVGTMMRAETVPTVTVLERKMDQEQALTTSSSSSVAQPAPIVQGDSPQPVVLMPSPQMLNESFSRIEPETVKTTYSDVQALTTTSIEPNFSPPTPPPPSSPESLPALTASPHRDGEELCIGSCHSVEAPAQQTSSIDEVLGDVMETECRLDSPVIIPTEEMVPTITSVETSAPQANPLIASTETEASHRLSKTKKRKYGADFVQKLRSIRRIPIQKEKCQTREIACTVFKDSSVQIDVKDSMPRCSRKDPQLKVNADINGNYQDVLSDVFKVEEISASLEDPVITERVRKPLPNICVPEILQENQEKDYIADSTLGIQIVNVQTVDKVNSSDEAELDGTVAECFYSGVSNFEDSDFDIDGLPSQRQPGRRKGNKWKRGVINNKKTKNRKAGPSPFSYKRVRVVNGDVDVETEEPIDATAITGQSVIILMNKSNKTPCEAIPLSSEIEAQLRRSPRTIQKRKRRKTYLQRNQVMIIDDADADIEDEVDEDEPKKASIEQSVELEEGELTHSSDSESSPIPLDCTPTKDELPVPPTEEESLAEVLEAVKNAPVEYTLGLLDGLRHSIKKLMHSAPALPSASGQLSSLDSAVIEQEKAAELGTGAETEVHIQDSIEENENMTEDLIDQLLEKPVDEPVVHKSMDEPVVQKPVEEPDVQKVMHEPVVHKPMDEPVVQKPVHKPDFQELVMKEPVVEKPVVKLSLKDYLSRKGDSSCEKGNSPRIVTEGNENLRDVKNFTQMSSPTPVESPVPMSSESANVGSSSSVNLEKVVIKPDQWASITKALSTVNKMHSAEVPFRDPRGSHASQYAIPGMLNKSNLKLAPFQSKPALLPTPVHTPEVSSPSPFNHSHILATLPGPSNFKDPRLCRQLSAGSSQSSDFSDPRTLRHRSTPDIMSPGTRMSPRPGHSPRPSPSSPGNSPRDGGRSPRGCRQGQAAQLPGPLRHPPWLGPLPEWEVCYDESHFSELASKCGACEKDPRLKREKFSREPGRGPLEIPLEPLLAVYVPKRDKHSVFVSEPVKPSGKSDAPEGSLTAKSSLESQTSMNVSKKVGQAWSNILLGNKTGNTPTTRCAEDSGSEVDVGHVDSVAEKCMKSLRKIYGSPRKQLNAQMEIALEGYIKKITKDQVFYNPTVGIEPERRDRLLQSKQCSKSALEELEFEKTLHELEEQRKLHQQRLLNVQKQVDYEQRMGNINDMIVLQNNADQVQANSNICALQVEIVRLNFIKINRYFKSGLVEVLPPLLRLESEKSFLSAEGALLFMTEPIMDSDATKLYALRLAIQDLQAELQGSFKLDEKLRMEMQLGWYHLERRSFLSELGIVNDNARFKRINTIKTKIKSYRSLLTDIDIVEDCDLNTKIDLHKFVKERLHTLDTYLNVLYNVQKDESGRWMPLVRSFIIFVTTHGPWCPENCVNSRFSVISQASKYVVI